MLFTWNIEKCGYLPVIVLLHFQVMCGGAGMTVSPPDKAFHRALEPGYDVHMPAHDSPHTTLLPRVHVKVDKISLTCYWYSTYTIMASSAEHLELLRTGP